MTIFTLSITTYILLLLVILCTLLIIEVIMLTNESGWHIKTKGECDNCNCITDKNRSQNIFRVTTFTCCICKQNKEIAIMIYKQMRLSQSLKNSLAEIKSIRKDNSK
jgi:hypothetical protein